MREVRSPPPQPEDPDRALDPRLEEDPDIFVELIDKMFYQLSCDDAMVAITPNYPGLLPALQVRKIKIPTPKLGSPFRHFTHHIHMAFFTRKAFRTPCRTRSNAPTGGTEAG